MISNMKLLMFIVLVFSGPIESFRIIHYIDKGYDQ